MKNQNANKNWTGRTDGTSWMLNVLIRILRHTDQRFGYFLMAFTIPYYLIFGLGTRDMYRFYRRFGFSRLKSALSVVRTQFTFGQIVIDKFAAYAGRKFNVYVEGKDVFDALATGEKGFVQLSSHVGCYEMAGYFINVEHKTMNALVYAGESPVVMQNRKQMMSANNINMILVGNDFNHIIEINAALDRGEVVSIPADRIFGSQKSLTAQFLGHEAHFPLGPFKVAKRKGVPVTAVFVMKLSWNTYRVKIVQISYVQNDTEQQLAQRFANELEAIVRQYPWQWFNFFDFWRQV